MKTEGPVFVPPGYSVTRKLGSGQTSNVYLTKHDRLGEVALKLPHQELQHRPILRRMFENEVQITLSLEDEHIVQALDGFPTGEKAFLVLEYCSGGTLDQLLLEKGRLPLEKASKLILDVAMGLWHSHQRQVLHRDVKPANVFLTGEGRAKLGDFGTGIFLTDRKRLEERVGTAFYMAPEVFEGQPSEIQGDVYSLGVLTYEVLAGVRPFLGDSYDELMLQHLTSLPRSLRSVRQDVSKSLSQLVSRAMSRDASKRFSSVKAFIAAYSDTTGIEPFSYKEEASQQLGRASRAKAVEPVVTESASLNNKKRGRFSWFRRKKK